MARLAQRVYFLLLHFELRYERVPVGMGSIATVWDKYSRKPKPGHVVTLSILVSPVGAHVWTNRLMRRVGSRRAAKERPPFGIGPA